MLTTEDAVAEPDETFTVGLTVSETSAAVKATDMGTGTIENTTVVVRVTGVITTEDDNLDLPSTLKESAGPTVMKARVATEGGVLDEPLTVTVMIENGTAAGIDYHEVAAIDITIPAQRTSATESFTLTPIDDRLVEGDETIILTGSVPGYAVEPEEITILDDDVPAFSLSVQPSRVGESDGATPLAVTAATGGVTFPDAVTVVVSVGGGTASEGTDYAEVADFDLTISAGQPSATETSTLTPVEDALHEGDETIDVTGVLRVTATRCRRPG